MEGQGSMCPGDFDREGKTMRGHLYGLVSVLLLVGSVSLSTGQTLLFSVHGGGGRWQGRLARCWR